MTTFTTLNQAINHLNQRGYIYEFQLTEEGIKCPSLKIILPPESLTIHNFYRFKSLHEPFDNQILYILETDLGMKGYLVTEYDLYLDPKMVSYLSKIPIQTRSKARVLRKS